MEPISALLLALLLGFGAANLQPHRSPDQIAPRRHLRIHPVDILLPATVAFFVSRNVPASEPSTSSSAEFDQTSHHTVDIASLLYDVGANSTPQVESKPPEQHQEHQYQRYFEQWHSELPINSTLGSYVACDDFRAPRRTQLRSPSIPTQRDVLDPVHMLLDAFWLGLFTRPVLSVLYWLCFPLFTPWLFYDAAKFYLSTLLGLSHKQNNISSPSDGSASSHHFSWSDTANSYSFADALVFWIVTAMSLFWMRYAVPRIAKLKRTSRRLAHELSRQIWALHWVYQIVLLAVTAWAPYIRSACVALGRIDTLLRFINEFTLIVVVDIMGIPRDSKAHFMFTLLVLTAVWLAVESFLTACLTSKRALRLLSLWERSHRILRWMIGLSLATSFYAIVLVEAKSTAPSLDIRFYRFILVALKGKQLRDTPRKSDNTAFWLMALLGLALVVLASYADMPTSPLSAPSLSLAAPSPASPSPSSSKFEGGSQTATSAMMPSTGKHKKRRGPPSSRQAGTQG